MKSSKVVLSIPAGLVSQPLASEFVSDFGLIVNIMRARIEPNEAGVMALELTGEPAKIEAALDYARSLDVKVKPLTKDILWDKAVCVECTACLSVCPSGALHVRRTDFKMNFDGEKCIACGLCLKACPYGALSLEF